MLSRSMSTKPPDWIPFGSAWLCQPPGSGTTEWFSTGKSVPTEWKQPWGNKSTRLRRGRAAVAAILSWRRWKTMSRQCSGSSSAAAASTTSESAAWLAKCSLKSRPHRRTPQLRRPSVERSRVHKSRVCSRVSPPSRRTPPTRACRTELPMCWGWVEFSWTESSKISWIWRTVCSKSASLRQSSQSTRVKVVHLRRNEKLFESTVEAGRNLKSNEGRAGKKAPAKFKG